MKTLTVEVTREITIKIRRFDKNDWRFYSSCPPFGDGSAPFLAEVEDVGTVLADKSGLFFELLDPGALNGVTQYGYNMTLNPSEAEHAVEIFAQFVAQGQRPESFFGTPRRTIT